VWCIAYAELQLKSSSFIGGDLFYLSPSQIGLGPAFVFP
jgi:hypothetical protein